MIRTLTEAHLEAVHALEKDLFPHDYWPLEFFHAELAETFSGDSGRPGSRRYWVAEDDDGVVIGYAGMMCALPLADVQTLAVAPAAQGGGLGAQLLRLMIAESRRRGATDLLLEVRADNPPAQRLYLREGFEEIRRRAQYYSDGEEAIVMRLML